MFKLVRDWTHHRALTDDMARTIKIYFLYRYVNKIHHLLEDAFSLLVFTYVTWLVELKGFTCPIKYITFLKNIYYPFFTKGLNCVVL